MPSQSNHTLPLLTGPLCKEKSPSFQSPQQTTPIQSLIGIAAAYLAHNEIGEALAGLVRLGVVGAGHDNVQQRLLAAILPDHKVGCTTSLEHLTSQSRWHAETCEETADTTATAPPKQAQTNLCP